MACSRKAVATACPPLPLAVTVPTGSRASLLPVPQRFGNARRDSLEGFWRPAFGYTHALMVVDTFYENVEGPDGGNQVVHQFTPRTGDPMLVACLWSHWVDPAGKEPDLLSFAAITDEPEPEVAAAGHDRTIINIKPEHVDAWLNPDPLDLGALYAIFDDKRHPFYEHRLAA